MLKDRRCGPFLSLTIVVLGEGHQTLLLYNNEGAMIFCFYKYHIEINGNY